MTGIAYITAVDMRGMFTTGRHTVVATIAAFGRRCMIKGRHQPCRRQMTRITGQRRWNMGCGFTAGNHVVMATDTGSDHL